MIGPRDEKDLLWYFGRGQTVFGHSPFGEQLEHAAARYRDSAGKVIDRAPAWTWVEARDTVSGQIRKGKLGREDCVVVHDVRQSAGYEPDLTDFETHGRVSRRLVQAEAILPGARAWLEALYGDDGERWAAETEWKQGRAWALAPLTAPGRKELRRLAEARAALGQPASELLPAEQLAEEARLQKDKPTERRRVWLERLGDATDLLLRQVEAAWLATRATPSTRSTLSTFSTPSTVSGRAAQ